MKNKITNTNTITCTRIIRNPNKKSIESIKQLLNI